MIYFVEESCLSKPGELGNLCRLPRFTTVLWRRKQNMQFGFGNTTLLALFVASRILAAVPQVLIFEQGKKLIWPPAFGDQIHLAAFFKV